MSRALLHERVARRWALVRRTTVAAVVAAIASVVALALAAPSGVHAAAVVVAAAIGAAWPQGDRRPAALRWVGTRAGLAYETAVEAGDRGDPFGLLDAVRVQGRLSIRDVAPPDASPWWVPAAVLAGSLWLWGAFVGVPWSAPWAPAIAPPPTPAGPSFVPPVAEPDEVPAPEEAEATEASAPRSDEASSGGAGGEGGVGDRGAGEGSASERDALERFAEGLREREVEPAAAAVEDGEESEEAGDPGGESERSAEGDPDEGAEVGANAPDPSGEGDPSGDASSEGEGDDPATAEGDEAGEGTEPGEAAGPSDGAPEDGGELAADGEDGAEGAAGVDPGLDPGDAGLGAGTEGDAAESVADDPREAEALESILGAGPETPIGGVALPGAEGDAVFPSGAAGAAYRRAVEEALTEGEVPVTYQEVIRNYFR